MAKLNIISYFIFVLIIRKSYNLLKKQFIHPIYLVKTIISQIKV